MAPRRTSLSSSSAPCDKRRSSRKCKRRRPKGSGSGSSRQLVSKVCLFCEKTWPTYHHLEMHMNTHTKERPYECEYCDANFGFWSAQLVHQNNVHLGKRYSCNLCPKTFTVSSNLVAHRRKAHYSQSKRAIFNGIQKVTKEIGILKGKRIKMKRVGDDGWNEDSKMPVVAVPKKAVPTTSQLFNLVNSLQKVTQRKRKISGGGGGDGKEQVPGKGVSMKHRRVNGERSSKESGHGQVVVEVKEENEEETVVEIEDGGPVVEEVKEEVVEEGEDGTEPLRVTSTLSQPNDDGVSAKHEKHEDNQPVPSPQISSVPLANDDEDTNQKKTQLGQPMPSTSRFPSMVNGLPFLTELPSSQQSENKQPCWYNRPPDPPPNLMFYFNGHTVPVLSLDILRNLARSKRTQSLPSPPASQSSQSSSSSSDPDSDYKPRAATSSRKQSTTSSKSSRKKGGDEPEPSSSSSKTQRQSKEVKKTVKRRTKNSLKSSTVTLTTSTSATSTKLKKGRKKGPNSAAQRRIRNYPNKCEECGETFKYPSNLVIHMIKHTGARPFSCTLCASTFSRKGNLNQHMERIHSQKNLEAVKVEDVKTEGSSES